jgi:hypothetical protein
MAEPNRDSSKGIRYSYWQLFRDFGIFVFIVLPDGVDRLWLLVSDKPLLPYLQERGVSVSWLLLFTVPIGLLLFFKAHRVKVKDEAAFLFEKFPKHAPLFCLFSSVSFFCWFCMGAI